MMNKLIVSMALILCLTSCDRNRKIKSQNDSGDVKSVDYYGFDHKLDSTYFYYPGKEIKQIIFFDKKGTFNYSVVYNTDGSKQGEGNITGKDKDQRIGIWHFPLDKETDSIVNYINVSGKPFVNQIWIVNKNNKDTIRGNFYDMIVKDTIDIGDTLEIRFYLYSPHFSYNSEMEIIIPDDPKKLKEDFSNFHKIKKDTFFSLKNDGIPHPEIPKAVPKNHYAGFRYLYTKPGEKRIRGYIAEYIFKIIKKDTTRIERRLYFDETIYVKEDN